MALATAAVLTATLGLTALAPAAPASAKGGEVAGGTAFYLADTVHTTRAETTFTYGTDADSVLVGDTDGDGRDTLLLRRGTTIHLRDTLGPGTPDATLTFGHAGAPVFLGDWDGDGVETLAYREGNTFHLSDNVDGTATYPVAYGRPDDVVLVGDWDGDGTDTFAVRRESTYHLANGFGGGAADIVTAYGRADDAVFVGNFSGSGRDTLTVRRGNVNHVKYDFSGGAADVATAYGRADDVLLVGDWAGTGRDSLGVRREGTVPTVISPAIVYPGQPETGDPDAGGGTPETPVVPEDVAVSVSEEVVTTPETEAPEVETPDASVGPATPPPAPTVPVDTAQARIHWTMDADGGTGLIIGTWGPYQHDLVAASEDFVTEVAVGGMRGRELQVQRRAASGAWTTVWSSGVVADSYGVIDAVVPATGRGMTATYRLHIPAAGPWGAVTGDETTIRHQDRAAFAAGSTERMMSEIIAPYCPTTPLVVTGFGDSQLLPAGGGEAYGLAFAMHSEDGIGYADIHYTSSVGADSRMYFVDSFRTYLALHECAHIVAREFMGFSEYESRLTAVYGDRALGKDESVADALAYYWMTEDPARNGSAYFEPRIDAEAASWSVVPHAYVGKTYLDLQLMSSSDPANSRGWVIGYAGDDALLRELTAEALARR